MERLKRALVWLSRIRHVQGFGVQSPTDFRFVKYVILERDPYYKYAELQETVAPLDDALRKLCCLYFRLSNYCKAEVYVDVLPSTTAYAAYVKAACGKTMVHVVTRCDMLLQLNTQRPLLVRISWHEGVEHLATALLDAAPEGSVVVLEAIKEGRGVRSLWKVMTAHSRVGACYDLYYCGIIIVDNRRYKKKYIINF